MARSGGVPVGRPPARLAAPRGPALLVLRVTCTAMPLRRALLALLLDLDRPVENVVVGIALTVEQVAE